MRRYNLYVCIVINNFYIETALRILQVSRIRLKQNTYFVNHWILGLQFLIFSIQKGYKESRNIMKYLDLYSRYYWVEQVTYLFI